MFVGIGVLFGTVGSASAEPSAGDWAKLRACESGGNYSINTGNGYYGAYQFDRGTWASVGGSGLPSNASPATQDALAYKLWQQRGWNPWSCARIVGLPAGGSGGPSSVRTPAKAAKPKAKVIPPERQTGRFDSVRVSGDAAHITVRGWAVDLNAKTHLTGVRVTLDGRVAGTVRAGAPRPDVNRATDIPGAHGYVLSVPALAGVHRVCVTALGRSAVKNKSLGCRTIRVPGRILASNKTVFVLGRVVIAGWTYDNRAAGRSNHLVLSIDGVKHTVKANLGSATTNANFRISGRHRYWASVALHSGRNRICLEAVGAGGAGKRSMGCRVVVG